jgi:hypothetical protein
MRLISFPPVTPYDTTDGLTVAMSVTAVAAGAEGSVHLRSSAQSGY